MISVQLLLIVLIVSRLYYFYNLVIIFTLCFFFFALVVPSDALESEGDEESEALNGEGEACNLLDKKTRPDMVKETVNEQSNHNGQDNTMIVNSSDSSGPQQENRSYASIVSVCLLYFYFFYFMVCLCFFLFSCHLYV